MAKKRVSFVAKKTFKEPRVVRFNTKQGEVSFRAKIKITKPVRVSFTTKNTKKKK